MNFASLKCIYFIYFTLLVTWQKLISQKARKLGGLLCLNHIREENHYYYYYYYYYTTLQHSESHLFFFRRFLKKILKFYFFLPSVILFWERRSRAPVDFEAMPLCSSQWMKLSLKGHTGVAKTKGIMGITSKMEDLLLRNLLFQISSDFVTFETNFRDGFSEPTLCWT